MIESTLPTFEEFCETYLKRQSGVSPSDVLRKLEGKLRAFEEKYGMSSEEFYEKVVGTLTEDEPDFLTWAILYRSYLRVKEKMHREVENVSHGTV